ncbi:MAG: RNA polymerase sigma factor [Clostridia bacterium]|nr:RNA polymerase sigma factor [Clostridia bacterium]
MQDRDIIDLYFARDERAIAETSQKYGTYCMSIAQRILHNLQDAEECLNDTWLRTWNTIPPARPGYLQQFVGSITRHVSLDKYRSNSRRDAITVALEEIGEISASDTDIATQAEEREIVVAIDRFLWSLPKRERGVFIRRYYHFDEIKSIAKRYGLGVSNVKIILSRTRTKLREYLEKEGYAL